jgi:putative endonuclease
MHYVYLLKSLNFPDQYYVGLTTSLKERLKKHNTGASTHTAKFRPWKLVVFVAFVEEAGARQFEKYMKSGSGREFSRRHFRG